MAGPLHNTHSFIFLIRLFVFQQQKCWAFTPIQKENETALDVVNNPFMSFH